MFAPCAHRRRGKSLKYLQSLRRTYFWIFFYDFGATKCDIGWNSIRSGNCENWNSLENRSRSVTTTTVACLLNEVRCGFETLVELTMRVIKSVSRVDETSTWGNLFIDDASQRRRTFRCRSSAAGAKENPIESHRQSHRQYLSSCTSKRLLKKLSRSLMICCGFVCFYEIHRTALFTFSRSHFVASPHLPRRIYLTKKARSIIIKFSSGIYSFDYGVLCSVIRRVLR